MIQEKEVETDFFPVESVSTVSCITRHARMIYSHFLPHALSPSKHGFKIKYCVTLGVSSYGLFKLSCTENF